MTLDEQIAQITNPQEFTRLCNAVLTEKYGQEFQVIDGSRSDEGNDGYIISEKRIVAMYCPIKPERRTDADYLKKIRNDVSKAQALRDSGQYEIENWTFLTPRKLSNKVIVEMRREAGAVGFSAIHQESTFLANELIRNRHLISEFPDLHISFIDSKLAEIFEIVKTPDLDNKQSDEEIDKDHIYKAKAEDQTELDRVFEIRRAPHNRDTKPELKTIYYRTDDPVVKLNALLGLLDHYSPIEDAAEDMVQLCDEGIAISAQLAASSVKAHLLSFKAYFISSIYSMLDLQTAYQIKMDNAIGIPTITEEYRQEVIGKLKKLEQQFDSSFGEALNLTKDNNDFLTMASVLISIGNAAGQRALYLQTLNVKDRVASEKATCRRAFLAAKEIYSAFKDELGVATALFNLGNQIRFFGEEAEAMSLAQNAVKMAKKYDDANLLQRAEWLVDSLETGKIPDYLSGERRE